MPKRARTLKSRSMPRGEQRRTAAQRGYGHRWQVARLEFLRAHPLCVLCEAAGLLTAATVVDHITPHKGNYDLFWDQRNWQPLCRTCHNRKTATEDGGFGRTRA